MKKRRKVCVVVTARPSYARVRSALVEIENHPDLELCLIIAGSALLDKYGSIVEVVKQDGFTIDDKIYNIMERELVSCNGKSNGHCSY